MWKTAKLSDVMRIARGGSPRPIKSFITHDGDGVNWIKIGDTNVGTKYISSTKEKIKREGISRSRYVKKDDFLLSNSMSFGRPYILRIDGCIHDGWLVLSDYSKELDADYLYYLLSSSVVQSQFESSARGSTVRNLNIDLVSNVLITYPPLAEQQRIVAKLDAAFAEIDTALKVTRNCANETKSLFQNFLDRQYEKGASSDRFLKLKDLISIKHGFAFSGKDFNVSNDQNLPIVLTPGNFSEDALLSFNGKNTKRLNTKFDGKLELNVGDLVVVMTDLSSKMLLLGKPAFIEKSGILHNQRIGLVVNPQTQVVNKYLYYYFISSKYLNKIKQTASGTMVRHTAPKRILENEILVPNSFEISNKITERLDKLKKHTNCLMQLYNMKCEHLKALKSAILTQELKSEAA